MLNESNPLCIGSPPTFTNRLCEWLVITMKHNKLKKQDINNDDYYFARPIIKSGDFRLVCTLCV